jgi:hypothetical protein
MKKTFLTLIVVSIISMPAFALSMNELEGKYLISSKLIPIASIITLDNEGNIELAEQSGKFTCEGTSRLLLKKITAIVKCTNNVTFKLVVNLNKVEDFNSFTAPIKISINGSKLGMENSWEFQKYKPLND